MSLLRWPQTCGRQPAKRQGVVRERTQKETPSIEETALALEALADAHAGGLRDLTEPVRRAALWLADATRDGTRFEARPIGLYFAQLWYSERLYPIVFTTSALRLAQQVLTS